MTNAGRTLEIEAGAVTDNPIVFDDEDIAISGGNFHAQPVAFAADMIAMALCEVGSISERRTAVLIDPKMSGLPAFLTDDCGVNSGLMIPQVTAAALVAENRSLAFPASVDSIPTSAGQEDHVSMAPIAARKAVTIARNAAGVVAVELIAAAQGVDYHAPLKTSAKLQKVHGKVRAISPHLDGDRYWADEMAALQAAVLAGEFGAGILADAGPALLLADESAEHAAPDHQRAAALHADRRRGADVALGIEGIALVGAVALGPDIAQDPGSDQGLGAALARGRLGLGRGVDDGAAKGLAAGRDPDRDAALGVFPPAFERRLGKRRAGQGAGARRTALRPG